MKKLFVLTLIFLMASAVSSFANTSAPDTEKSGASLFAGVSAVPTGSSDGTLIGKLSKGVYAGWACDANGYILTTQHMSGNRSFGSSHDATAIFRYDATSQDPSGATDIDSSYFADGWTAM